MTGGERLPHPPHEGSARRVALVGMNPCNPRPEGLAPVRVGPVRLVFARCSVDYVGRLTAHLPEALRLLIVKADGSVLVHSDGGSYKPLNWMSPPCRLTEAPGQWTVTGKSGETLIITLTEVVSDTSVDPGVDPGLVKN